MVRILLRRDALINHTTVVIAGEIVRLHGLGNEIVILNTLDSINDLLVKQGNLYADRPSFTFASELAGGDRVCITLACYRFSTARLTRL